MNKLKAEIFPLLDIRTQEKIKDSLTIEGDKPYLEMISLYFVKYYKITYNVKTDVKIREILNIKHKPKIVNIRKWIGYFAYRTGRYTWKEISIYMNLVDPKGSGLLLVSKQLQEELNVNKVLQKEYEIHLANLKELFITFTLSRI